MNTIPHSFPQDVKPRTPLEIEVDNLHRQVRSIRFSYAHDEPWRNVLARELDTLLGRVLFTLETSGDETDVEFAKAALSVVERVANFEEIESQ